MRVSDIPTNKPAPHDADAMLDLLTHSAGIPEVRGLRDLLHADLTPSGG